MDGLLADTEPLWHEVECAAYAEVGLAITAEECMLTMGLRVDEAVAFWYARTPSMTGSPEELCGRIVERMVAAIATRTAPMPGALELIDRMQARGWGLALASSSPYAIIDAVLTRCGLRAAFSVVHSAQDEERGKPDPAIYLTAAAKLGVAPTACVALEDSVNGMVSAKAARMQVIAVPMPAHRAEPAWGLADVVVDSLVDVDDGVLERLAGG